MDELGQARYYIAAVIVGKIHLFYLPVVVENRPGAGSSIGMRAVAKSPADGYTIGLGNIAGNAINPAVQAVNLLYERVKDFAAISLVGVTPLIRVVNAQKIPMKTVP